MVSERSAAEAEGRRLRLAIVEIFWLADFMSFFSARKKRRQKKKHKTFSGLVASWSREKTAGALPPWPWDPETESNLNSSIYFMPIVLWKHLLFLIFPSLKAAALDVVVVIYSLPLPLYTLKVKVMA